MERPRLGFDLSFEYEKDLRKGPFSNSNNTAITYTETVDLETEGWVYHPALLTYKLGYLPEWKQNTQESRSEESTTSSHFLNGYFTELTFLQYKPYTLILNASRDETTTRSNLAEKSSTVTDTYGATFIIKYPILPTTLRYTHSETNESGLLQGASRRNYIFLNMQNDKYLGTTTLSGTYSDNSNTIHGSTINTNQFKAGLTNSYYFTEEKDIGLNSNLSYEERDSSHITSNRYSIYENLLWRHRQNLSTYYSLKYDRSKTVDKLTSTPLDAELKSIGFGLSHLLFENLTTRFNFNAGENNSHSGKTSIYDSRLDFNYIRAIPWGVLNLTSGFNYMIFDTAPRDAFIFVTDEPLDLSPGITTFLKQENITADSIVIEDATGFIYTEGIDYTIVKRGTLTGIRPLPSINDITNPGKSLFIAYKYSNPAYDYASFGQSYGINVNLWKIWNAYYRLNLAKQIFISGIPPDSLQDNSIHTAGTTIEWKWNRIRLEWKDEYTTTATPTRTWNVADDITLRPDDKTFFFFSAQYGKMLFKDSHDFDKTYSVKSGLQKLLGEKGSYKVDLFYDKISGTTDQYITKGLSSVLEWNYAIYTFVVTYSFRREDDETSQSSFNNNYFLFNIKRTLF